MQISERWSKLFLIRPLRHSPATFPPYAAKFMSVTYVWPFLSILVCRAIYAAVKHNRLSVRLWAASVQLCAVVCQYQEMSCFPDRGHRRAYSRSDRRYLFLLPPWFGFSFWRGSKSRGRCAIFFSFSLTLRDEAFGLGGCSATDSGSAR